ncbi:MAG: type VI secretion system secreted protein Hcp [Cryomorphaceae bacterium]|jgi:type VI secretion system secreted protein Hcp
MNIKLMAILLMLLPSASYAAVDMFLDIEGVPGETQDGDHLGEIDVLAWSWGASSTGNITCVQDVSITKHVDLASPELLMGQVENRAYNTATLTVRKAGATPLEFVVIKFNNVYVSSYFTGASGGEDRLTEKVTLNFQSAEYIYTSQDATGVADGVKSATIYPSGRCK